MTGTLTVADAAIAAGVTRRTIRRWIKAGMPTTGPPARPLISIMDLAQWWRRKPRPGPTPTHLRALFLTDAKMSAFMVLARAICNPEATTQPPGGSRDVVHF